MLQTKKNKISVWCKHKLSGENQCRPVHHLHKSQTCKEPLPSSFCCLQILEALSSSGKIKKKKRRKEKRKCFWSKHLLSLFYTQALCFWTHLTLFPYWRNGLLASGLMPKPLLTRILWTISEFLLNLVFVWPPLFGLLRKSWTAHENTCLLPNFSLWKTLMIQGVHFEFLSSFRFSVEAKRSAWPF